MPPAILKEPAIEELQSFQAFLDALGQRESSDNYQLINGNGAFIGRYQLTEFVIAGFSAATLYTDDDLNDGTFDGTFTGARGINSLQDFLNAEALQDEVFTDRVGVIGEELIAAGLDAYAGSTIDGILLTVSSLVAGIHLVGQPAVEGYFNSDKASSPTDGFGTPVTEYFDLFSGFDLPFERGENGSAAATRLLGSNGADTLLGAGGNDTLDGLGGADTAQYRSDAAAYRVTRLDDGSLIVEQVEGNARDDGTDQLNNIERLAFADRTVEVGTLSFDEENSVTFEPSAPPAEPDDADEADDASQAVLTGTAGRDKLKGGAADERIEGLAGDDIAIGYAGDDQLNGGTGADFLCGGAGNDTLNGGADDDELEGRGGNDVLRGGTGDDTLNGGLGADTLDGGEGSDTFRFVDAFGQDVVRDYDPDDDRLEFSEIAGVTSADDITIEAVGTSVRLSVNGQSVNIIDTSVDDLDGEIFIV